MSQLTERFIQRLCKGINAAFKEVGVSATWDGPHVGVPVKAEEVQIKGQGISMGGGAGLAITIGNRRAEFNADGELANVSEAKATEERRQTTDPAIDAVAKCPRCEKYYDNPYKVGKECNAPDRNGDRCIGIVESVVIQTVSGEVWGDNGKSVKVKRWLRRSQGRLQHSDNQRDWVDVPNQ